MIEGNLAIIWSGVYETNSTRTPFFIFFLLFFPLLYLLSLPPPLPFKAVLCRTAIIRDKDGAFLAEGGDEKSIEPTSQSISQQGFSWGFYSSTNHSLKNIGFSYLLLVVSDWHISHPILVASNNNLLSCTFVC